jgi:hypothetical protein
MTKANGRPRKNHLQHAWLRSSCQVLTLSLFCAILLAGCSLFGTSQAERVMRFEYDLNHNRQYAYQNFLESATNDYVKLATQDPVYTWNRYDWFPPAEWPETTEYTISVDDVSGETVQATVTGPSDFSGPQTLTFGMVRSGIYWYIEKLTLSGSGLIVD